jgi:cholestenol delta-isomerase
MRHGFQVIISMAHLYGDVLYYATSFFELWFTGASHSRPEPLYFWVYFVGFNAPWIIVPIMLIWSSLHEIAKVTTTSTGAKEKTK